MAGTSRLGFSIRGLLRFAALLVAACMIGALVGLVTEPLEQGTARSITDRPASPAASELVSPKPVTLASITPDAADSATRTAEAESAESLTREAFAPDLRGLYIAGGGLLAFGAIAMLFARKSRATRPGNGAVHLVDTLSLGAGRRVHLLRVDGRKFLIGNSERGLHFLASVPQNDAERAFDAALGADEAELAAAEGEPTFDRNLTSALQGSYSR
jgi:flagellar biogenesis protein FliO